MRRNWIALLLLGLVTLGGAVLRLAYGNSQTFLHVDENIPLEVVNYIRRKGVPDTNWARACTTKALAYTQYNFSGYLIVTYLLSSVGKVVDLQSLRFLSALEGIAVIVVTFALAYRLGGRISAFLASGLVALNVQSVEDAHYARPEALFTLITLLAVFQFIYSKSTLRNTFLPARLVGFLISIKVSALPLVLLVVARMVRLRGGDLWRAGSLALCGLFLGALIGAPMAFTEPAAYLSGVHSLQKQYSRPFAPFSHVDGGPVTDYLAMYYYRTLGPIVLCGLIGGCVAGLKGNSPTRRLLFCFAVLGITVLQLAFSSVFLERNISHAVPVLLIIAALALVRLGELVKAKAPKYLVLALVCVASLSTSWWYTSRFVFKDLSGQESQSLGQFIQRAQLAQGVGAIYYYWENNANHGRLLRSVRDSVRQRPGLLVVVDYGDEFTVRTVESLPKNFDVAYIDTRPSLYGDLPPCGLDFYHSSGAHVFRVNGLR